MLTDELSLHVVYIVKWNLFRNEVMALSSQCFVFLPSCLMDLLSIPQTLNSFTNVCKMLKEKSLVLGVKVSYHIFLLLTKPVHPLHNQVAVYRSFLTLQMLILAVCLYDNQCPAM